MTLAAPDWFRVGAAWAFVGVAAGTFGAHGLERATSIAEAPDWWHTAVLYHLVHALGLVAIGLSGRTARFAGWSMALGSLVFSGTLYALALGAPSWFGAITPIGGICMLLGWLSLAVARAPRVR